LVDNARRGSAAGRYRIRKQRKSKGVDTCEKKTKDGRTVYYKTGEHKEKEKKEKESRVKTRDELRKKGMRVGGRGKLSKKQKEVLRQIFVELAKMKPSQPTQPPNAEKEPAKTWEQDYKNKIHAKPARNKKNTEDSLAKEKSGFMEKISDILTDLEKISEVVDGILSPVSPRNISKGVDWLGRRG